MMQISEQPSVRKGFGPGESFKTGAEAKRARQAAYVEWLLTPPGDREPKTKTAFAEQWGVTTQTLHNDEGEPFTQRQLAERARAGFKAMKLPEVIRTLSDIATGKAFVHNSKTGEQYPVTNAASVSAAKVLLDWAEKTSAIREEKINFEDLTDSELIELALGILQQANDDDTT